MSVSATSAVLASEDAQDLRCGDLLIDRRQRRVFNLQGDTVALGSRALDLLLALIDAGGEPLSADALRAQVWRGRDIADNNLRVQITQLRRVLGRDAVLHRPGIGYQLMAPVAQRPSAPPLPPVQAGNLPEPPWVMLGRDALLGQVCDLVGRGTRVSLVGPAGVGKTTLALAAAQDAAMLFPDGAWWVELAPLRDPSQLAQTVSAALQLPAAREQALDKLVSALSTRRLLLVLDNCEHLRPAVVALSDRLVRGAPGVKLLTTSRVALESAGEKVLAVPALSLPARDTTVDELAAARDSGAAAVFESRVRAADPRFRLTLDNAGTVLDICRRLDGNALAITLAAAQVPVLGLLPLRERLDERLRWTQRQGGLHAGHQLSLQATLDWTHDLLGEAAQRLLRRLGAFAGHFCFAAVNAVAAVDPPLPAQALDEALAALVDHGLLSIDSDGLLGREPGEARYTMHESARLYARLQLEAAGECEAVQGALAQWLLRGLKADAQVIGLDVASVGLVQRLMGDLQPAVTWAATHDPALGAALVHACSLSWRRLGLHALTQRLCDLLMPQAVAAGLVDARLDLLFSLMSTDFELQRHTEVIAHADAALALLDTSQPSVRLAVALNWKAAAVSHRDGPAASEALSWQALAIFRACGHAHGLRQVLNNLGWKLQQLGRYEEARRLLQEALELNRSAGSDWEMMVSHENLGELELAVGNHAEAACHFERQAVLARRLPDDYRLALALMYLTQAQLGVSGTVAPLDALRESLHISLKRDFLGVQADCASVLALLLSRRGEHRLAMSTLACAHALRRRRHLVALAAAVQAETEVRLISGARLLPQQALALQAQGAVLGPRELLGHLDHLEASAAPQ